MLLRFHDMIEKIFEQLLRLPLLYDIKKYLKFFFRVKRTKGYFFDIISNWKWLSVEIGYMALLVAFDIPSEFDVLLAACG